MSIFKSEQLSQWLYKLALKHKLIKENAKGYPDYIELCRLEKFAREIKKEVLEEAHCANCNAIRTALVGVKK